LGRLRDRTWAGRHKPARSEGRRSGAGLAPVRVLSPFPADLDRPEGITARIGSVPADRPADVVRGELPRAALGLASREPARAGPGGVELELELADLVGPSGPDRPPLQPPGANSSRTRGKTLAPEPFPSLRNRLSFPAVAFSSREPDAAILTAQPPGFRPRGLRRSSMHPRAWQALDTDRHRVSARSAARGRCRPRRAPGRRKPADRCRPVAGVELGYKSRVP